MLSYIYEKYYTVNGVDLPIIIQVKTLDELTKNIKEAVDLHLRGEDISNIVGTATESCIRMLSELKKEKLITTSGKKIKINDSNTMQKLAEGIQY